MKLSQIHSPLSIPLWSDFIAIEFRISVFPTPNFQSHYGLILSRKTKIAQLTTLHSFNPTMVWFYPYAKQKQQNLVSSLSIPLWSDFIDRTPRTAVISTILSIPLWSDFIFDYFKTKFLEKAPFNPTMVWFYRSMCLLAVRLSSYFQSHYGLILSTSKIRDV